jgi:guanylate kinase
MAGLLLVVSGPSGAGKSTVMNAVMGKRTDVFFSVSVTTRPPRAEEKEGREYHFVSPDEFSTMQEDGRFLEVGTFAGHRYGTPRDLVMERLDRGETVVLDIESAGAAQVKATMPECVLIFLTPGSEDEAERRLRKRGTENEEAIVRRMNASQREYMHIDLYRYIVINDNIEEAVAKLEAILIAEAARTERNRGLFSIYRNARHRNASIYR